jgi:hypothetical protein
MKAFLFGLLILLGCQKTSEKITTTDMMDFECTAESHGLQGYIDYDCVLPENYQKIQGSYKMIIPYKLPEIIFKGRMFMLQGKQHQHENGQIEIEKHYGIYTLTDDQIKFEINLSTCEGRADTEQIVYYQLDTDLVLHNSDVYFRMEEEDSEVEMVLGCFDEDGTFVEQGWSNE